MRRTIRKRLNFLITDYAYQYKHMHQKHIYHKCIFTNSNNRISVTYDCHWDNLELEVICGTSHIVKVFYNNIIWGPGILSDATFEKRLNSIYSFRAKQIHLSSKQFHMLIELFADLVYSLLGDMHEKNSSDD